MDPSSLDAKSHAMNQGARYFAPRGLHNAAKSLAGHIHLPRRLILIHSLGVGQAQSLELIQLQHHFVQIPARHARRLEQAAPRRPGDVAIAFVSRHELLLYPVLILSICS